MGTFVLVHGAWHGGWCWQRVAPHLRAAGHDVLAPTLTGLGERSHLLTPEVDLSMHVEDLVAVFEYERPVDAIVVGHSYAGLVLAGAAARLQGHVRHYVFLDAFVPDDGACALDLLPEKVRGAAIVSSVEEGDGWRIPKRSLAALGVVDEEAAAWLTARLTPHPFASYTEPVATPVPVSTLDASFVLLTGWNGAFVSQADKARALGWDVTELQRDHEALATAPMDLAGSLLERAAVLEGGAR